jgi:hypothetical protein
MYLAWTNGERDEDIWPSHEVYATSEDGEHWTKPQELFPQGVSTSLRMYFFCAPNGRMLTVAGLRVGTEKLDEAKKGGLVVREILADHTLGPVYTLTPPPEGTAAMKPMPSFETSGDAGFVEACRQLLENHTFREQQDFGTLLGKERMAAYETKGGQDKDFGRAMCFYYRKDGTLVGVGKKAFVILSKDNGKTWTEPVQAKSIVTGNAKVWVQQTTDGRYMMLYNPHPSYRFPLVCLSSDDGITFKDMRLINGDVPLQRYAGVNRTPGDQYMRGVSIFANDGSRKDKDAFVAYSANKEDIWVSQIPIPLKLAETGPVEDRFEGADPLANWNVFSPLWASVTVGEGPGGMKGIQLQDGDPYDFAKVVRVFAESASPKVTFTIVPETAGVLEVELRPGFGVVHPVRLVLSADGKLEAQGKQAVELGSLEVGKEATIAITAYCAAGRYTVSVNGHAGVEVAFAEAAGTLGQLEFRTGPSRAMPARASKTVEDDKPLAHPARFLVSDVRVR